MTRRSKYCCQPDGQGIQILTTSDNAELGYIEFPSEGYPVRAPDGEYVAIVHSIEDGLTALLDYWDRQERQTTPSLPPGRF